MSFEKEAFELTGEGEEMIDLDLIRGEGLTDSEIYQATLRQILDILRALDYMDLNSTELRILELAQEVLE